MGAEFDLITIGGGSGGVAAARRAAMHGARVMLIERDRMGGTCVMRGCVPKKLLMYASQFRTFYELGGAFGWSFGSAQFDMRQWQAAKAGELDRLESVYRSLLEQAGVQVVNGSASIVNPHCVLVGDRQFTCRQLLIATGSSPATAPVHGLDTALTSEDILNLQAVPKRLAVVGAGYIGVEFASMFAKLGSEVTLIFREPHPLKSFDADLRRRLSAALEQEGVKLQPQTTLQSVVKKQDSYRLVCHNGQELSYDAILNATGRMPNTEGLHLEELGIGLNGSGAIPVDHYSRTAVSNVYAVGDVTNRKNLTPVAIAEGRAFADTVFGKEDRPFLPDEVATAVFTGNPIGTIGLTEVEAASKGDILVYETEFRPMLTAFAHRPNKTYMKLLVDAQSDRVLGMHMIGADAPEIIQSLAVALRANATKGQFDQTVAVHPTAAEEFVLLREPTRRITRQAAKPVT